MILSNWRLLAQQGVRAFIICTVIGIVVSLAQDGGRMDLPLIYSYGVGLSCWMVVDVGRLCIDRDSPYGFPRGWRGTALIATGILVGFLLGGTLSAAYFGVKSFEQLTANPRLFVGTFGITALICTGITLYHWSVTKSVRLATKLAATQRQAAEAQLMLLQSQLEPHMLFNTLANLRVLIGCDVERATVMLDRLNSFLRATLDGSRLDQHALQSEFGRLRDYLELMSVRMGPRLRFELDLPNDLRDVPMPPFLLQPLVENAIKHGLEPKKEGGVVVVRAIRQANMLLLEVTDDGNGISDANMSAARDGFGLSQVRERLETSYGGKAHFSMDTPKEGGARAILQIPLI